MNTLKTFGTKGEKLVKFTSTGKISIRLNANLKPYMLHLLELVLQKMEYARVSKFDRETCGDKAMYSLISEAHTRHFTMLSMSNGSGKIIFTYAQAVAFWDCAQEYSTDFYKNPEIGNILLQLHQTLS